MDKYIIFLDIDGTLTDSPHGFVSDENIRMINRVRALGHYVFINTGRSYAWIPQNILKIPLDGVISGMGTQIRLNDKIIFESSVRRSFLRDIIQHFKNSGIMVIISGTYNVYTLNNNGKTFSEFEFIPIKSENDFETLYPNERIQKVEIFNYEISDESKKLLESELDVYYHSWYLEANPKNNSKTTAMETVLKNLDIPKSQSIAVGDSINDIGMLTNAGIAAAMGNASPEVKEIADFVSTDCRENGVAYALEKLIINKQ